MGMKTTECARGAMALDGDISREFEIVQGGAQGCTLSPTSSKVFINDLIVSTEAAEQGVKMGEDTLSGLMFANDIVKISEIRIAEAFLRRR